MPVNVAARVQRLWLCLALQLLFMGLLLRAEGIGVMVKRRRKQSRASFPARFSADIHRFQDGDTTKTDPLFILVINNIALEKPSKKKFVADMSTNSSANKKLFNKTAKYIKENLFGELPGQAEKLLAGSPHSAKIKFWSMYLSGLPVDGTTSLVAEHELEASEAIKPRRDAVVSMLARVGLHPDVIFIVSRSPNKRAWAIPTTDDDARGGIAGKYDGKRIYHRFYHKIPGMIAMGVDVEFMTPAHEFGHAFSSFSNGHVVDLYSDTILPSNRRGRWPIPGHFPFNRKIGRPIPRKFATYQGKTYPSDKKRNSLGYDLNWTFYHPGLADPTQLALMDEYTILADPMLALHDKITKAYIMDRVAAKVSR